jgi:hypothetical protein
MKKILKENSIYLIILTIVEIIISSICTLSFVYTDTLNYNDSMIFNALGMQKLLQTIYSSTWWALILTILALIAILSVTTLVFKKLEYLFIGTCLWIEMFILTLDFNKSPKDLFFSALLILPIIIINIIVYNKEKEFLQNKKTSKK